ncbi:hypothetical protein GCM10010910_01540 [Microbacterium nanhaiense]|uniref:RDD family protein n=1 Tax=Microbacterium nanhaiense TaxID=1301026 RepID=A0ABQ2MW65_9MICO|nr:hypothetical protein [Microbacterium nanhaiense]GGO59182.1 hypothetical protein GCM10010910_01540 [Microbacterium nanhaiense]
MTTPTPGVPNVVITNPKARKIARTVLDVVTLVVAVVVSADLASDAFDALAITTPALAVLGVLRPAFGLGVDNPNTPTA